MVLNRADKKQFEVFRSVNNGSKVEQRPYNHNIPYGGSIKCFSEDEFNVAVANMFTYPAKIAHLELIGNVWVLYKNMPLGYTSKPLYYVKGASKKQQDFVNSLWFLDQKSITELNIRFD